MIISCCLLDSIWRYCRGLWGDKVAFERDLDFVNTVEFDILASLCVR